MMIGDNLYGSLIGNGTNLSQEDIQSAVDSYLDNNGIALTVQDHVIKLAGGAEDETT